MSQAHETPLWERVAGLIGLALVLGVLAFLLYEALQPQTKADIRLQVESVTPQEGGYLVTFTASNAGRTTAAAVLVEGALHEQAAGPDPSGGDEPLESAEMTFDYIPDQSDRTGMLLFVHDPRQYAVRLQVKGFAEP